jgi:hypothetical protein
MCYYCHVLKNNPRAPIHQGVRCLDRSNLYSQVPMHQRMYDRGQPVFPDRSDSYSQAPMSQPIYDQGQPVFPEPSAPPAEGKFCHNI